MIFGSFFKALGQIGDPRFRRVMGLGVLLALALLAAVYAGFLVLINSFVPGTIDLIFVGPITGIDALLGWGSLFLMLGLSVFLMVPVASAFSGLFLEDIADAVEDPHYTGLPPVTANATNAVALWPASIAGAWAARSSSSCPSAACASTPTHWRNASPATSRAASRC